MAELLCRWLNQDVCLSTPIQAVEQQFANGYYFGELLMKLGVIPAADFSRNFIQDSRSFSAQANWTSLSAVLKNMGVHFDSKVAKEIMQCKVGAAMKMLYEIKMNVQKREQAAMVAAVQAQNAFRAASPMRGAVGAGATKKSASFSNTTPLPHIPSASSPHRASSPPTNFRPSVTAGLSSTLTNASAAAAAGPIPIISPKGHQPSRPLDRVEQRRLTESLIHLTHASAKEKHMALHLEPFTRKGQQLELDALRARDDDEQRRLDAVRAAQARERDRVAENQAFLRTWQSSGAQQWRENMERIEAAKASRSEWNAKVSQRLEESKMETKKESEYETRRGIEEFERNLQRIGVVAPGAGMDDDIAAAATASTQQSSKAAEDDAMAVHAKLTSALGSPAHLAKQSAQHMSTLHQKCVSDALARKERDERRRRILREQVAEESLTRHRKDAEAFKKLVEKNSKEERMAAEATWRTQQLFNILQSNASQRASQECVERERLSLEQQRREKQLQQMEQQRYEQDIQNELQRFATLKAQHQHEEHLRNTKYARHLVRRLVELSMKVASWREVTEGAMLPPQMWREWMTLFVEGRPIIGKNEREDMDEQEAAAATATVVEEEDEPESASDAAKAAYQSLVSFLASGEASPAVVSALSFSIDSSLPPAAGFAPILSGDGSNGNGAADAQHLKDAWSQALTGAPSITVTAPAPSSNTGPGSSGSTPKSSARKLTDAGKKGGQDASAATSTTNAPQPSQVELDVQSLTTSAFYRHLSSTSRHVSSLLQTLSSDVSEGGAQRLDERALEDYLEARHEWSYDLKEVGMIPEELKQFIPYSTTTAEKKDKSSNSLAPSASQSSLSTPNASSPNTTSSPPLPRSPSRPTSSGGSRPPSRSGTGSRAGSRKGGINAKDAAAAGSNNGEDTTANTQPSLVFLPPLHPLDSFDLTEPLPPPEVLQQQQAQTTGDGEDDTSSSAQPSRLPTLSNPLFGALLSRIIDVASGKIREPDLPEVPKVPLALALIGRPLSGKSEQASMLSSKFGLEVIEVSETVGWALSQAEEVENELVAQALASNPAKYSKKAPQGSQLLAASKVPFHQALVRLRKSLAKSDPLPDELLVALLVERIKKIPQDVEKEKQRRKEQQQVEKEEQQDEDGVEEETGEEQGSSASVSHHSSTASLEEEAARASLIRGEGGFVLVGFPTTVAQANMLEVALSGFEAPEASAMVASSVALQGGATGNGKSSASSGKKSHRGEKPSSLLARAPSIPPLPKPYPSALHRIIRLDASKELVVRRALGGRVDTLTGDQWHLAEKKPTSEEIEESRHAHPDAKGTSLLSRLAQAPPNGSSSASIDGGAEEEDVDPTVGLSESLLHYDTHEQSLEAWFELFGNMEKVQCETVDEAAVAASNVSGGAGNGPSSPPVASLTREWIRDQLREIVRDTMHRIDKRTEEESRAKDVAEAERRIKDGEVVPVPTSDIEVQALKKAAERAAAATMNKDVTPATEGTNTSDPNAASSLVPSSSTSSFHYPTFTPHELYNLSSVRFYDRELAIHLLSKWSLLESTFLQTSRSVFRGLRRARNGGIGFIATMRKQFRTFLRRADSKQLVLDSFVKAFNELPQDLRQDAGTKEELHLRLEELMENLARINSAKHEENEQEFARVAAGAATAAGNMAAMTTPTLTSPTGQSSSSAAVAASAAAAASSSSPSYTPFDFLDSHSSFLFTLYALLMQLELDRYAHAVKIGIDFFAALKGVVIPDEIGAPTGTAPGGTVPGTSGGGSGAAASGSEKKAGKGADVDPLGGALPITAKLAHISLPLSIPKPGAVDASKTRGGKRGTSAGVGGAAPMGSPNAGANAAAQAAGGKKGKGAAPPPSTAPRRRFLPSLLTGSAAGSTEDLAAMSTSSSQQSLLGFDPFTEILDIIRKQIIDPDEALEFFMAQSSQDLDTLQSTVLGASALSVQATGRAGAGGKGGKNAPGATGAGGKAGAAAGASGAAGNSAAAGGRAGSASRRRGKSVAPVTPIVVSTPATPTRDGLIDAQLHAFIAAEARLLSSRIRRIHRNALLELVCVRKEYDAFLSSLDRAVEERLRSETQALEVLSHWIGTECIENERPIERRIRIEGENFYVDTDALLTAAPVVAEHDDSMSTTAAAAVSSSRVEQQYSLFGDLFAERFQSSFSFAQLISLSNTLRSITLGGSAGGQMATGSGSGAGGVSAAGLEVKSGELLATLLTGAANAAGRHHDVASHLPLPGEHALPPRWLSSSPSGSTSDSESASLPSQTSFLRSLVGLFAGGLHPHVAIDASPLTSASFVHPTVDYRDFLIALVLPTEIDSPSMQQLVEMQDAWSAIARAARGQLSGENDGGSPSSSARGEQQQQQPVSARTSSSFDKSCVDWSTFQRFKLWFEPGGVSLSTLTSNGVAMGENNNAEVDESTATAAFIERRRRTEEPMRRLKEFLFHLFAFESSERSSNSENGRVFVISPLDLLLYLCFDDETASDSASISLAPRSGFEKSRLLFSRVSQRQWGPIARAFYSRFMAMHQDQASNSRAKTKFKRKNIQEAAHMPA